ncbi:unnamed protein product [Sphagnum jensenii]|uniref:TOD1/MUCI70 glycosyltransferase-like domain-containing protein n=1 Tax=Sphagnum jensenii TaxID=128206 RepID=A0ABP0VRU3_9BRYO
MQTGALQQKLEVNDDDYDDNGEEEESIEHQGKNTDEGDNNEEVQCNNTRSRHDGSSPVLEGVPNSRSAGDISQQDNKSKTGVDLHQDAGSSEDWQKSDADIEKVETHPHAIVQKCIKRSRHKTTRFQTTTKENVCFVAFVNQASLDVILQEQEPNPIANGTFGLWRIVLSRTYLTLTVSIMGKCQSS